MHNDKIFSKEDILMWTVLTIFHLCRDDYFKGLKEVYLSFKFNFWAINVNSYVKMANLFGKGLLNVQGGFYYLLHNDNI